MKRIAIIGAGSWGTALSVVAGNAGHQVCLWSRNADVVRSINVDHLNCARLTETPIPAQVRATARLDEALECADLVILAAPSHAIRSLMRDIVQALSPEAIIVSATKGIEIETASRISEIVADVLGEASAARFVCLSGPSFAKEVIAGHPTAIVAASASAGHSGVVQSVLSFKNLRLYTNDDVIGVELGGSIKNVIAIAAGMVAGLGYGSNSIAALITRGLAEMTRLAIRAGGKAETLMGLAGLGDLVLTCTGGLSRNRFVGHELARGRSLEDVQEGMQEIAEGVITTLAVRALATSLGAEMPICNEVYGVLYERKLPRDAVTELMTRPLRSEFGNLSACRGPEWAS